MTHGLTYLPQVDKIIVLSNGVITEEGTYRELLERKGKFQEFLLQYLSEVSEEDDPLEGRLNSNMLLFLANSSIRCLFEMFLEHLLTAGIIMF